MTNLPGAFLRHATSAPNRAAIREALERGETARLLMCERCRAVTGHTLARGDEWTTITCTSCGRAEDWRRDVR